MTLGSLHMANSVVVVAPAKKPHLLIVRLVAGRKKKYENGSSILWNYALSKMYMSLRLWQERPCSQLLLILPNDRSSSGDYGGCFDNTVCSEMVYRSDF